MHGEEVTLICSGDKLEQVYYFHEVKGNAIDGSYKASPPRKLFLERVLCKFRVKQANGMYVCMQLRSRIVRSRGSSTCPRKAVECRASQSVQG